MELTNMNSATTKHLIYYLMNHTKYSKSNNIPHIINTVNLYELKYTTFIFTNIIIPLISITAPISSTSIHPVTTLSNDAPTHIHSIFKNYIFVDAPSLHLH